MEERMELIGSDISDLENLIKELDQPKFRAKQLFSWLYNKKVDKIKEMTNLSKELRAKLEKKTRIERLKLIKSQESSDGTVKYLFGLSDGNKIESVYMPYRDGRRSICISTQVGCGMGCNFCATGLHGLSRNLTAGEIVNQILTVEDITGEEISNVVFMGMGEPLANYDRVLKAIRLINSEQGMNIGMRRITLSTCGLIPQIESLAQEKLQLTLAISLHAANNKLRSQMMPINAKYPVEELIPACKRYTELTGRRITFEYAIVDGLNDSYAHARELAKLLRGMLAHVNLIPINEVEGIDYTRPQRRSINLFKEELDKLNIPATIRVERGGDIDAACGQLQGKEDR
ncbi:23S rRNA (adenine(2503)-C(2))-methyltransferase RlmN [Halonatronum saccharophilum]|uniref:23S rRNA (adenine(2503)-C(2))-methyltransferase RlmN n=1 Tax=Halonatronum saccharophilum TaxID=150060 RepID=UPI000486ADC1|nr:23S rRNA (adenine(2503)-C(2))-methyltransferase RlmN [Halonatronum saccharophilum]